MNRMTPEEAQKWLGIKDGRLHPCPKLKNCVCSQHDDAYFIEPLDLSPGRDPISKISALLSSMPGYEIVTHNSDYLHATFTSIALGFVDDLEFLAEPESKLVHVRSASRLGYWDLGANRRRVEKLRHILQKRQDD